MLPHIEKMSGLAIVPTTNDNYNAVVSKGTYMGTQRQSMLLPERSSAPANYESKVLQNDISSKNTTGY